jgi:nucleoside-diphosphate-sugar epimerase
MRVFVTGGTGAIGSYAVPALVQAGHAVRALARSDAKAEALRSHGATPISLSLFDTDALTRAFENHDAVINLVSALPSTTTFVFRSAWRECERVRTEGSASVVDAAQAAGVPRLLQESVAMIYSDGGSTWINEDHPVDHYPIARGNHAAEGNARRFDAAGGNATILRFGVFYGRGAAHSHQILELARHHVGFAAGRPDSYISSIHVADAGDAVIAALRCAAGTYNIVDDQPVTKRQYARVCADAVGKKLWVFAPGRVGLLLGDRLTSMTRSLRVSNAQFRDAAAWQPRYPSVREGYQQMA